MKYWILAPIIVGAIGCGPAEGRPRDEVMSTAFRCAVVDDGRQWLDCYYGAAQPIRSRLGLPPANPAQLKLAAAPPPGILITPEVSQARDAVMVEAVRCTSLGDDRQWLNCYYAAAQPMRARLGLTSEPQAAQSQKHPGDDARASDLAAEPRVPQFGNTRANATTDFLVSRITDYKVDAQGILTVMLANGQKWRQLDGDTSLAKLKIRPGSYVATIKSGLFHSHSLTIRGVPGVFRVRQID